MDNQPNHCAKESVMTVMKAMESKSVFSRFLPKNSTSHSQPVDHHVGRSLQQKVHRKLFKEHQLQNDKRMRGQTVEKIGLKQLRRLMVGFINDAWMDLVNNEKRLIQRSFDGMGMAIYSNRIWNDNRHDIGNSNENDNGNHNGNRNGNDTENHNRNHNGSHNGNYNGDSNEDADCKESDDDYLDLSMFTSEAAGAMVGPESESDDEDLVVLDPNPRPAKRARLNAGWSFLNGKHEM